MRFEMKLDAAGNNLYKGGVKILGPVTRTECIDELFRQGEDNDTLFNAHWQPKFQNRLVGDMRAERIKSAKAKNINVDARGLVIG